MAGRILEQYLTQSPELDKFQPTSDPLLFHHQDCHKPTGKEKLWIILGPGGVGKNTILDGLVNYQPYSFRRGVTSTTRPKRPGEQDGVIYNFVTETEFHQTDHFESNFFNGSWYGIPKQEIDQSLTSEKITLFQIDINGLKTLKTKGLEDQLVSFFVLPEDLTFLEKHYQGRENPNQRMKIATQEIAQAHECDYLIINPRGKVKKAINSLIKLTSQS